MKLWILKPKQSLEKNDNPWEPWYDKNHGFVIRAESENDARKIAHNEAGDENNSKFSKEPWLDSKYSSCDVLLEDGEAGLIMEEYLPG